MMGHSSWWDPVLAWKWIWDGETISLKSKAKHYFIKLSYSRCDRREKEGEKDRDRVTKTGRQRQGAETDTQKEKSASQSFNACIHKPPEGTVLGIRQASREDKCFHLIICKGRHMNTVMLSKVSLYFCKICLCKCETFNFYTYFKWSVYHNMLSYKEYKDSILSLQLTN